MANNQIAVKYTEENYVNKSQLSSILGTSLIDPIWNEIIKYRNTLKHQLEITDIFASSYYITNTTKVKEKNNNFSQQLTRFNNEYNSILGGNISKGAIKKNLARTSLRTIAKLNNILVNDLSLDKVIDNKAFEESHLLLFRYYDAVKKLQYGKIDEEFLANNLMILRGEEELTSFYRMTNIDSASSKYLISKEFDAAPVKDIEPLMNGLMSLLNNDTETTINKIAAILYMLTYIKPFEKYNNEMSLIMIKNVIGKSGSFLPTELLLTNIDISKYFKEIQKSRDLTYLFFPVEEELNKIINSSLDKIVQLNGHDVQQAYLAGDDKKEFENEFGFEPKDEIIAPVTEQVEEKPIENIVVQPKVVNKELEEYQNNEKELKHQANEMLESDPYLKKAQAHFYVRHCTPGKFYTIQQFKNEEGCVYETARTSMDNLAKLGYYRREQIKNKFVYTPMKR